MSRFRIFRGIFIALALITFASVGTAAAQSGDPSVQAQQSGTATRFAPGDSVPFSVKLVNFGSSSRIDVSLWYQIVDMDGNVVESQTETVAVETTASFVRQIVLPDTLPSGSYLMRTTIGYDGRKVPTTSEFQFSVERRVFGFFVSDLLLYGTLALIADAVVLVLVRAALRRSWRPAYAAADYSSKPQDIRIYYEVIDTTIRQMRLRVGDTALVAASGVPGLIIDPASGAVVDLRAPPTEILESLVLRYETALGQHVRERAQILKLLGSSV